MATNNTNLPSTIPPPAANLPRTTESRKKKAYFPSPGWGCKQFPLQLPLQDSPLLASSPSHRMDLQLHHYFQRHPHRLSLSARGLGVENGGSATTPVPRKGGRESVASPWRRRRSNSPGQAAGRGGASGRLQAERGRVAFATSGVRTIPGRGGDATSVGQDSRFAADLLRAELFPRPAFGKRGSPAPIEPFVAVEQASNIGGSGNLNAAVARGPSCESYWS